jgi:hypothetical protein
MKTAKAPTPSGACKPQQPKYGLLELGEEMLDDASSNHQQVGGSSKKASRFPGKGKGKGKLLLL